MNSKVKITPTPKVLMSYSRGVKLTVTRAHISLTVAFKGPNVILGLYKCSYSLTRGKELYIRPIEGNQGADVAPGENEFDTPSYRNQRGSSFCLGSLSFIIPK